MLLICMYNGLLLGQSNILQKNSQKHQRPTPNGSQLHVIAVGDVMIGTDYPNASYLAPDSGKGLLNPLKRFAENYTVNKPLVFANLEGCLFDSVGTVKNCQDTSKCYAFRMPTYSVQRLTESGINLVSIANNHVGDFGISGVQQTHQTLKTEGIYHAGILTFPLEVVYINGKEVGFVAFTFGPDGPNVNDSQRIQQLLSELNTFCDIIVVSMHIGAEGNRYGHVTRSTEFYLDENRGNPYWFAHFCIDHGADLILGHGPHVPRGMEMYKQRLIAYSLGNFCTYKRFSLLKDNSLAPIIAVDLHSDGSLKHVKVSSYKQHGEGVPRFDIWNRASKKIRLRSKEDFPESFHLLNPCVDW